MMFARTFTVATLAAGLMVGTAHADMLALYTFPGSGSSADASQDVNADSTASDFQAGAGIQLRASSFAREVESHSRFTDLNGVSQTSEAGAVAEDDYWFFTIEPNSGLVLNLDELLFSHNFGGTTDSGAEWIYFVRSSVDGFASTVGSASVTTEAPSGLSDWPTTSVDLSGVDFQGLTGTTEFRIYVHWNSFPLDAQFGRIDNVQLIGDAVPEPASAAMIGLGGMLFLARRRRA